MDTTPKPAMTRDEVVAFLERDFPQIGVGRDLVVEEVGSMSARLRLVSSERLLRAGGTISGPAMFALADVGMYVAILGQAGPLALAVTINLNINFLRKPPARDMIGDCRLLRIGRRIAFGEALLYSEGDPEPVAHATGSYSLPQR